MLDFIPNSACNILEIGCGEGAFSQNLKRVRANNHKVINITAIEIDPLSAEKLEKNWIMLFVTISKMKAFLIMRSY